MIADATAEERVASLSAEWLSEHGSSDRRVITRDSVFEIAWRLIQTGMQPTVENIRRVNGGGSPNGIHPLLREFYACGELRRRWHSPAPALDVPAPLAHLWQEALTLAHLEVGAEHQLQRDALDARSRALDTQASDVELMASQAALREEEMRTRLRDLRARIAAELRTTRQLATQVRQQTRRAARSEQSLEDTRQDLRTLEQEAMARGNALADQGRTIETLRQHAGQLEREATRLGQGNAELTIARDTLQVQRDAARHALDKDRLIREHQETAIASLHAELNHTRGEAEATRAQREQTRIDAAAVHATDLARLDALSEKVTERARELTTVARERDVGVRALATLEHRVILVQQEADRWQAKADELTATLARTAHAVDGTSADGERS
jgi:chromosome segregation ATPase